MANAKKKVVASASAAEKTPIEKALEAKAAEPVKTEVKAAEKKEEKPAAKKEAKTPAKAEEKKEVKTAAKKSAAKKTPAKKTARKTIESSMSVQFAGKSYNEADLVKIAKDVWKYDLKKKVGDFKSVELYVKPEESMAYYVINGEVAGSFNI